MSMQEWSSSSPEVKEAVRAALQEVIRDNKLVVVGKEYCQFTRKANDIFDNNIGLANVSAPHYARLFLVSQDKRNTCSVGTPADWQECLSELTGAPTMPRVFLGGKFIGGESDVEEMLASGKLEQSLRSAGLLDEKLGWK